MLCQLGEDGGGNAGCREVFSRLANFGRLGGFVELLQHRKNRAITAGKASLFDVRDFSNSITPVFNSEIFEWDNKRFFLFDRDHVTFVFEKEGHL